MCGRKPSRLDASDDTGRKKLPFLRYSRLLTVSSMWSRRNADALTMRGVRPDDLGLLARGRGAVDLRGGLAVGDQAVQGDARRHRRLAVALPDLGVASSKPAIPVRPLPAEQRLVRAPARELV